MCVNIYANDRWTTRYDKYIDVIFTLHLVMQFIFSTGTLYISSIFISLYRK